MSMQRLLSANADKFIIFISGLFLLWHFKRAPFSIERAYSVEMKIYDEKKLVSI